MDNITIDNEMSIEDEINLEECPQLLTIESILSVIQKMHSLDNLLSHAMMHESVTISYTYNNNPYTVILSYSSKFNAFNMLISCDIDYPSNHTRTQLHLDKQFFETQKLNTFFYIMNLYRSNSLDIQLDSKKKTTMMYINNSKNQPALYIQFVQLQNGI